MTLTQWIDSGSVAVSISMLGVDMMFMIFNMYYIKVFLNIFKLSDTWLNISQILFLVWNAVNDPMFGLVQDIGCGNRCKWVMVRRKVILYCSPIFVISFLLFWFPWVIEDPPWVVGLHLMTALFLFDAMFSLVVSAQCGMVTEITTAHAGRVRVLMYNEFFGLIVDKLSNNLQDFTTFQICCCVISILSGLCYLYTGLMAPKEVAQIQEMALKDKKSVTSEEMLTPSTHFVKDGFRTCVEVFCEKDFWCIVLANFFHILRWTADMNFLVIFVEALVSPNGILPLGSVLLSVYYQCTASLPKIFCLTLWPVLKRLGPWNVLMASVALICANSLVAFFVGRHVYVWVAAFIFIENLLTSSIYFAVYFLFFPDVIDLDMKKYNRKSPISTLIFTLNALLTKPAQSLAPIIVVAFLSGANYKTYQNWKDSQSLTTTPIYANFTTVSPYATGNTPLYSNFTSPANSTTVIMTQSEMDNLFDVMFLVACFFPMITAILEALLLLPYSLKFRYKRDHQKKTDSETVKNETEFHTTL